MTDLWRIKTFLFLVLELQVTAVSANTASVLQRAGEDAMLSCQNVAEGQQNCNGTTWLFGASRSKELVALVTFGKPEGETRTRISVTPNCSLVIKNITAEDDGQYECQQDPSEGSKSLLHRSVIDLSVVTMTKHVENQTVTLNCSVIMSGSCKYSMKWRFSHQEMEKCKVKPSENKCSAAVIYLESNCDNSSWMDQLFQCEVAHSGAHNNVQLFSFSQHSSGGTTATQKPTAGDGNTVETTSGSAPYFCVGVALVVMVIIAMVVLRWRAKRNETRQDENAVDVDDGISYASIRHPEVLVYGDLDTVTYSTVRRHSSSAAASIDPNSLYSLIKLN